MCFPNRLSSTRILSLTIQATKRTPLESRLSAIEVLVGAGVCRLELRDATTLRSGAPAIFSCSGHLQLLWPSSGALAIFRCSGHLQVLWPSSGALAIFRVQACDERMLYLWSEVFDIQKLVRNCP
jgi:hypothetical protein